MSDAEAPSLDTYFDKINLVSSTTVAGAFYGAMSMLYFVCIYFLAMQLKGSSTERRQSIWFIVYTSVLFILGSIYTGTSTHGTMVSYVDHADFPGGPSAYNNFVLFSEPVGMCSNISDILATFLADGLLLWRVRILFQKTNYGLVAFFISATLYLGTIAMGIMLIVQTSTPFSSIWTEVSVAFTLPFFVLSVSMTVISTVMMISRLLYVKRQLQSLIGSVSSTDTYTSVSAILMESCALYGLWSLIFIILYAVESPIQYIFLSSLANVQIIAPLLVIFRVAQKKAWTSNTQQTLSTWRADSSGNSGTRSGNSAIVIASPGKLRGEDSLHQLETFKAATPSQTGTVDIVVHPGEKHGLSGYASV